MFQLHIYMCISRCALITGLGGCCPRSTLVLPIRHYHWISLNTLLVIKKVPSFVPWPRLHLCDWIGQVGAPNKLEQEMHWMVGLRITYIYIYIHTYMQTYLCWDLWSWRLVHPIVGMITCKNLINCDAYIYIWKINRFNCTLVGPFFRLG